MIIFYIEDVDIQNDRHKDHTKSPLPVFTAIITHTRHNIKRVEHKLSYNTYIRSHDRIFGSPLKLKFNAWILIPLGNSSIPTMGARRKQHFEEKKIDSSFAKPLELEPRLVSPSQVFSTASYP